MPTRIQRGPAAARPARTRSHTTYHTPRPTPRLTRWPGYRCRGYPDTLLPAFGYHYC